MHLTGLGGSIGVDQLSGPSALRHCGRSPDGDADSGSLQVSEKTKKKAKGTRKSSRRQVVSDSSSDDSVTHSSHKDKEEDEDAPPPAGGDKKRKATPTGVAEGSKKGRTLLLDCSTTAAEGEDEWLLRSKPLAKS